MTDPVPGCLMLGYGFAGNQRISSIIHLRSAFANFVWLKIYVFKCFILLTMTMRSFYSKVGDRENCFIVYLSLFSV